jgi:soluble lytic murein transglycosylase-like protein
MGRLSFAVLFIAAVSLVISPVLHAQTGLSQRRSSPGPAADVPRQQSEKIAERQEKALAGMAVSIVHQQSSIQKQLRNRQSAGFFNLPALHSITPYRAAPQCDSLPADDIDNLINTAAQRTSVAPELIRSVMRQESAFRPCAVSPKGAIGLMQLLPATAADLGVKDPFEPQANVVGGATLLKQLMNRYGGDLSLTLGAYNAGSGKVDAAMGVPMIPETLDYVSRILSRLSSAHPSPPATAPGVSLIGHDEPSN